MFESFTQLRRSPVFHSNETINICLDELYKNSDSVNNLSREQFRKLLNYCVKQNHFMFEDRIYDQIDGVAMGSPLGPVLANIFMSHLERNALAKYCGNLPSVYKRYVDDSFLVFNDYDDCELFLEYRNTLHQNIKFTVEIEDNDCLSFLDVLISRTDDGKIETSVYRKKIFSGLYMKNDSFVPLSFKNSLVYGLLNRTFKICSSNEIFKKEVKIVKDILLCNSFSCNYINRLIKRFLNQKECSEVKQQEFGPERKSLFLSLPYCGVNSNKLKRQVERIVCKIAPWSKPNIVFKPSYRLSVVSKLKSPVKTLNKSNVVYKINCLDCNDFYIGMTRRRLHKRLHKHKSRQYCAVFKHISEKGHNINFDKPTVLCSDSSKTRLFVKETFFAHKSLNVNIKSYE